MENGNGSETALARAGDLHFDSGCLGVVLGGTGRDRMTVVLFAEWIATGQVSTMSRHSGETRVFSPEREG